MQTTEAASEAPLSEYEKERGKPTPSWNHGTTQHRLSGLLFAYEDEYSIASELSLDLDGLPIGTTPDLCIYSKKNTNFLHDEVRLTEPPLVAVEIASPTQSTQDIVDKIQQMLAAGVQSCWLVQPAMQAITVYAAEGAAPKTVSDGPLDDPATDIEIDVAEVFA